jgi:HK97 family phage major capsid protein
MPTSIELREKRAGLIAQARSSWDAAQARENGATAEDRAEMDRVLAAANELNGDIRRIESMELAERDLDRPGERVSAPLSESRGSRIQTLAEYRSSQEYRDLFRNWFQSGRMDLSTVPPEFRDTILGTDSKGGYLSLPIQLAQEIVKQVYDYCFIRKNPFTGAPNATRVQLAEAKAVGIPQLATRMADANWTTEVQAVTEDTTMILNRRDLYPSLVSKLSLVSIRMLYGSTNIESLITTELAYKFALTEEKAFLTGSGSGQPLGIFTASANGIPTSRDVTGSNTTTAITADTLFAMKYSIKAPYRTDPSFAWLWSRSAINSIMTLKDSYGRYLWEPSLQLGTPDRLLNIPVNESEWVPNTFTTGLYVGALGALRYYWIADVDDLQVQRLVERYADTNQIGFIGRRYVDGSPVLGEAFARCKLA